METDTQTYLTGTGTNQDKMWEPEHIDRYIKESARENGEFVVINQELWEFLHKKYGYDFEVRRYWHKGQWVYQSTMEITMKQVPVILIFTD